MVTVGAVEGSSMRNPGTIMGVAEDGSFAGSLSGGCIEQAVVSEALDVLKEGSPRVTRFGAGSPYVDIKLPCGGGLDLHFQPLGADEVATACLSTIRGRTPFSIRLDQDGAHHVPEWRASEFDASNGAGVFGHWPAPRVQIVGHGAAVPALTEMARSMGCWASALTPDEQLIRSMKEQGLAADLVKRTTQTDLLESDPWTAIVFLFHDHDWEIDLMARAFELPHFYLGAMGGRKAHAMRCEALKAKGISKEQLATVRAPIGVFHSSRDPQTLALSTLAEIIRTYQDTDFEAALG
ncbi:XdhC family protein [Erythrobacter sp. JK5]|nr:XdhC family protein [Erythrobacter sp. JK5]